MSRTQLAMRILCGLSEISLSNIRSGKNLSSGDYEKILRAGELLTKLNMIVDDNSDLSIVELHSRAHRMIIQYKVKLIIVDYIQIMKMPFGENQNIRTSKISRALKTLALKLNVPIIALSQLSREVERRTPPVPQLLNLRDSGAIEQDADNVWLMYRPQYYRDRGMLSDDVPQILNDQTTELHIAKQRNAPAPQIVKLTFRPERVCFNSYAHQQHSNQKGQDMIPNTS
jgi:replicative DNA helicase